MPYEHKQAGNAGWTGDLNDDCWLERYGLVAHVECMDTNVWWFNICDGWESGRKELFNSSECMTSLPLTNGAKARCAAECMMELLRSPQRPGDGLDGWRPIETAPKDGTYIILYQPDTSPPDQVICCWDDDDEWWHCCDGKNPELPLRGHDPIRWAPLLESPHYPEKEGVVRIKDQE